MLCALTKPVPDERTDLGLKFPDNVFTNFIRVSCESGSELCARGVDAKAITHSAMNDFRSDMRVRIVGLPNENSHTC